MDGWTHEWTDKWIPRPLTHVHTFFLFSKSPTNVDWFIVDTDPGDAPKIHRAVDYWARHIVDQARNIPLRRNSSTVVSKDPLSVIP